MTFGSVGMAWVDSRLRGNDVGGSAGMTWECVGMTWEGSGLTGAVGG